jgi:hypothetical protein
MIECLIQKHAFTFLGEASYWAKINQGNVKFGLRDPNPT